MAEAEEYPAAAAAATATAAAAPPKKISKEKIFDKMTTIFFFDRILTEYFTWKKIFMTTNF